MIFDLPLPLRDLRDQLRKRASGKAIDLLLNGLATAGKLHPRARLAAHGVACLRDIPYSGSAARHHLLDVYAPVEPSPNGRRPAVLYVHGGGFRILSKETHWLMGLLFARQGFVVFNINYRLAPKHPFPAALEDAAAALRWLSERGAEEHGADLDRLLLAGESAGANLSLCLAICLASRRPEAVAQRIYETGLRPRALLPACGFFQVSSPERFAARGDLPRWQTERVEHISEAYLPPGTPNAALADPLVILEDTPQLERALPPSYLLVGTADPIADDTRRLERALAALGVEHQARYVSGEGHAFHALIWKKSAQEAWREMLQFAERAIEE